MTKKIEAAAAALAAISLGGAVAFAAFTLLGPAMLPLRSGLAICAGIAAGLVGKAALDRADVSASTYSVATFKPRAIEAAEESVERTDVEETPLVLDDVLHAVGPDARVVRLFDASKMPSPAELKARVDRYLGQGASWAKSPDASQALVEALTELRRSLR